MQKNKIKITWYGTASVRISAENAQLLIDPFYPFPDSKIRVAPDAYAGCSHILISHGHFDHISSISKIVRTGTVVYCTKTPYRSLRRMGVRKENLHLIRAGSVFTVGDFQITAYRGKHIKLRARYLIRAVCSKRVIQHRKGLLRKLMRIASCPERKESLCYLVEGYGRRILILGSLALDADTAYPAGADLALFPYQGSDTLCRIAAELYGQLRPQAVLLTHFDNTVPPFSSDVDTSEFENYMKKRAAVYKLRHGGSLEI